MSRYVHIQMLYVPGTVRGKPWRWFVVPGGETNYAGGWAGSKQAAAQAARRYAKVPAGTKLKWSFPEPCWGGPTMTTTYDYPEA